MILESRYIINNIEYLGQLEIPNNVYKNLTNESLKKIIDDVNKKLLQEVINNNFNDVNIKFYIKG